MPPWVPVRAIFSRGGGGGGGRRGSESLAKNIFASCPDFYETVFRRLKISMIRSIFDYRVGIYPFNVNK